MKALKQPTPLAILWIKNHPQSIFPQKKKKKVFKWKKQTLLILNYLKGEVNRFYTLRTVIEKSRLLFLPLKNSYIKSSVSLEELCQVKWNQTRQWQQGLLVRLEDYTFIKERAPQSEDVKKYDEPPFYSEFGLCVSKRLGVWTVNILWLHSVFIHI